MYRFIHKGATIDVYPTSDGTFGYKSELGVVTEDAFFEEIVRMSAMIAELEAENARYQSNLKEFARLSYENVNDELKTMILVNALRLGTDPREATKKVKE